MSKEAAERFEKAKLNALGLRVQDIGIDCYPGDPRPGAFIDEVIDGIFELPEKRPSMLFGAWVWDFAHIPREQWLEAVLAPVV